MTPIKFVQCRIEIVDNTNGDYVFGNLIIWSLFSKIIRSLLKSQGTQQTWCTRPRVVPTQRAADYHDRKSNIYINHSVNILWKLQSVSIWIVNYHIQSKVINDSAIGLLLKSGHLKPAKTFFPLMPATVRVRNAFGTSFIWSFLSSWSLALSSFPSHCIANLLVWDMSLYEKKKKRETLEHIQVVQVDHISPFCDRYTKESGYSKLKILASSYIYIAMESDLTFLNPEFSSL